MRGDIDEGIRADEHQNEAVWCVWLTPGGLKPHCDSVIDHLKVLESSMVNKLSAN